MNKAVESGRPSISKIALFQGKRVRKVFHEGEWWFVIIDVVAILTDSVNPRQYLKNMLNRDEDLAKGWVQIEQTLQVETAGGRQKMNCANSKGLLRLIQSVPSPKAEPFKMWLAQVGQERLEEIENPELAQERMKKLYEQKGYPANWIDKRLRGIAIRQNLTDEWHKRGIDSHSDFAILTAEISKASFGMTPSEYRNFKNLPSNSKTNLRDHMTDLELIFTMLGEASTTEIAQNIDAQGFINHA